MKYSNKCIRSWIAHDMEEIKRVVKLMLENDTNSMVEFEYSVCPLCPYMCKSPNFCWDAFTRSKSGKKKGKRYVDIMRVLMKAFYSNQYAYSFHFFKTEICPICDAGCPNIHAGSYCATAYLKQMSNERPMHVEYTQNYAPLSEKVSTIPLISVGGEKMCKIINRLWKIEDDKTDSEERPDCTEGQ